MVVAILRKLERKMDFLGGGGREGVRGGAKSQLVNYLCLCMLLSLDVDTEVAQRQKTDLLTFFFFSFKSLKVVS